MIGLRGRRTAVVSRSIRSRDGDWSIYVMNADGSGVEQVTDNENSDCGSCVVAGR